MHADLNICSSEGGKEMKKLKDGTDVVSSNVRQCVS